MTKHETYMDMVLSYSNFSKCQFTKVGAMAVNETGRVIATGVNGTLPGTKNCNEMVFTSREDHVIFTKDNELHAEANLLLELATSSTTFERLTIYLTVSPCAECFKLLLGLTRKLSTIDAIIYDKKYHRIPDELLTEMKYKAKQHHVDLLSLEEAVERELS